MKFYWSYLIKLHTPAGRPFPLQNCTAFEQSSESLHVDCIEGFDGGLPQGFLLELFEMPGLRLVRNQSLLVSVFPSAKWLIYRPDRWLNWIVLQTRNRVVWLLIETLLTWMQMNTSPPRHYVNYHPNPKSQVPDFHYYTLWWGLSTRHNSMATCHRKYLKYKKWK